MKNNRNFYLYIFAFFFFLSCETVLFAQTAKLHVDVGLNHFYKNRYLEAYKEFKTFDIGDIIGITGFVFKTNLTLNTFIISSGLTVEYMDTSEAA